MKMESNLMNAYLKAYNLACDKLKDMDCEKIAINTNTVYDRSSNNLTVKYLNKDYVVDCQTGEVSTCAKGEVTTTVKVLILHYLLHSKVKPLSQRHISFKEIPEGGSIYYQTFQKRAVLPLVNTFKNDLEGFLNAAYKLNGTKEKFGHASVIINVFPLVPVTYVIWQGDEEVSASGTILFDDTISNYLPVEDIVVAASFGSYEMMKLAK